MNDIELIFGINTIVNLLAKKPKIIKEILVIEGRYDERIRQLTESAAEHKIPVTTVNRQKIESLVGRSAQHQGVVGICHATAAFTENDLPMLLQRNNSSPFLLILDGIQDPHNLGACLRSAEAAGVSVVIAPKDRSVGITPVVRKVASGAAEMVPFVQVTNLARTLRWLQEQQIWLFGAAGDASQTIYEVDLCGGVALVLGAEGKGLRQLTRDICDYLVNIPMRGTVESLNVSVATGICLFEVLRQRHYKN